MNQDDFDIDSDDRPSRSQLKREAEALQDLGLALVELPQAKLDRIELPDKLREAIDLARRITAHGGKRRQLQYIGKLMRGFDVETVRAQLEAFQQADRRAAQRFHLFETLRDRLLAEGDDALGSILERYPHADRQHLRQLVRQADDRSDRGQARAPGAPDSGRTVSALRWTPARMSELERAVERRCRVVLSRRGREYVVVAHRLRPSVARMSWSVACRSPVN